MVKSVQNVIDLFCGCGGLSLGFERAGFNVMLGIDVWKDALRTFQYNHKTSQVLQADLSKLDPAETRSMLDGRRVDVIIGGPPCQGFSIAGKRIVDDIRNKLYKNFVNFVAFYKPKAFIMENVPNVLAIGEGAVREAILKDFSDLGYTVEYQVLTASDYGVPQNRKRAIFVGFRNGHHFVFPKPYETDKITSEEALSDLPEHSVDDGDPYPCEARSDYQLQMRCNSSSIFNHQTTIHKKKTVEIISLVPDGGNYKDLPLELQETRKVHIAWTRLNSKKPSFTIDTGHRHHFHYSYNRIPTARESARIQSFPDDFLFTCSRTSQLKQIGNAVPPLLGYAIAKSLLEQL
ncbi:MAG: DNA cytosine methyltransferase [Muribaculaceae bacterium]|nr:DNA cytosine methyltransferase [Muribaculaceae bacterium]